MALRKQPPPPATVVEAELPRRLRHPLGERRGERRVEQGCATAGVALVADAHGERRQIEFVVGR